MKIQNTFWTTVLLILVYGLAEAQTTFGPQQVIQCETNRANFIYATDLDGDGNKDILLASKTDNKIAWYKNYGDGNFGKQKIIDIINDTYPSICFVSAADLDGDGNEDVLASYGQRTIWYKNNGFGSFGAMQIIDTIRAEYITTADLDGDGDTDVLSASRFTAKIVWHENDGTGNFVNHHTITFINTWTPISASSNIVSIADLDGDGDLDVIKATSYLNFTATEMNHLFWYENDGAGNFSTVQIITNANAYLHWISYTSAADLDGDGDIDVLSASAGDDKIAWYINDGMSNFSVPQIITTAADGAFFVSAADLDSDGDIDVLSSSNDHIIAWYENDSTGNFGTQHIITTTANGAKFLQAVDIDGDGDLDLVSASDTDFLAWYENDSIGNFEEHQITFATVDGAYSVYAADLDGDENIDVLSASYWNGEIAWYKNDGTGNFGAQQIITTAADGAWSVYAIDLDNDGDMDVLTASANDSKIAWYENNGTGNFGGQQIISTDAVGAYSVYAADLDGDGDMDVLSASYSDSKIAWYENNGTGNFGEQQIISTSAIGARSVYAADLDGDGDMDVLSASYVSFAGKIVWYENDGTGNFGEQQIISTHVYNARSLHATDLDGDGDLDVLSDFDYYQIAWYENDGAGNFGEQQFITNDVYAPASVYMADLDNDGDMDVLSASNYDDKIAWYKNLLETVGINPPPNAFNNTLQPIQIIPNPATQKTLLTYHSPAAAPLTLQLYDLNGRLLQTQHLQATAGNNQYVVDMSRYAQGLYVVTLTNGAEVVSGKVVKE